MKVFILGYRLLLSPITDVKMGDNSEEKPTCGQSAVGVESAMEPAHTVLNNVESKRDMDEAIDKFFRSNNAPFRENYEDDEDDDYLLHRYILHTNVREAWRMARKGQLTAKLLAFEHCETFITWLQAMQLEHTQSLQGPLQQPASKQRELQWRKFKRPYANVNKNGMQVTHASHGEYSLTTIGEEFTTGLHIVTIRVWGSVFGGICRTTAALEANHRGKNSKSAWFFETMSGGLFGHGKHYSNTADSFKDGDILGILLDLDNGSILFFKNGEVNGPGFPEGSVTGPVTIGVQMNQVGHGAELISSLYYFNTRTIANSHLSTELRAIREAYTKTKDQARKLPPILLKKKMFDIFMHVVKNPHECKEKYGKVIEVLENHVGEGFKAIPMKPFKHRIVSETKLKCMIRIIPDSSDAYDKCVTVKLTDEVDEVDEGVQMAHLDSLAIVKGKGQ